MNEQPTMPKPEDVLSYQHQTWLRDPITIKMLKNLEKQRETIIRNLSQSAFNYSAEESFGKLAAALNTVDTFKLSMTNTPKFVEITERK